MKKIFLTSGLVLCMACPAFATTDIDENGQVGGSAAVCEYDVLGTYSGSAVFEAKWEANKHNLIYAPGAHGTGGQTITNGATYDTTITVATLANSGVSARTGYTFAGWNDGTANRQPGYQYDPYQVDADLTLTAQWTTNTYAVTYLCGDSKNDGTGTGGTMGTNPSNNATYDAPYTFASNPCTLNGYDFNGWVCVTDTGGTTVNQTTAAAQWTIDDTVTCTAQWAAHTIGLTWYNDNTTNNGQVIQNVGDAASCTYDQPMDLPGDPNKPGYTFKGWHVR